MTVRRSFGDARTHDPDRTSFAKLEPLSIAVGVVLQMAAILAIMIAVFGLDTTKDLVHGLWTEGAEMPAPPVRPGTLPPAAG